MLPDVTIRMRSYFPPPQSECQFETQVISLDQFGISISQLHPFYRTAMQFHTHEMSGFTPTNHIFQFVPTLANTAAQICASHHSSQRPMSLSLPPVPFPHNAETLLRSESSFLLPLPTSPLAGCRKWKACKQLAGEKLV